MVTWLDGSSPGVFHFNWLLPSLPDRPDGYARPQRREHPPLQQCSLVPAAPVCPGALPQWRPVQPPAGHLWMRLPEWVLRRTLSEQWVTHLSQFGHFNTEISFLRPFYEKADCSPVGSTDCQDCHWLVRLWKDTWQHLFGFTLGFVWVGLKSVIFYVTQLVLGLRP